MKFDSVCLLTLFLTSVLCCPSGLLVSTWTWLRPTTQEAETGASNPKSSLSMWNDYVLRIKQIEFIDIPQILYQEFDWDDINSIKWKVLVFFCLSAYKHGISVTSCSCLFSFEFVIFNHFFKAPPIMSGFTSIFGGGIIETVLMNFGHWIRAQGAVFMWSDTIDATITVDQQLWLSFVWVAKESEGIDSSQLISGYIPRSAWNEAFDFSKSCLFCFCFFLNE